MRSVWSSSRSCRWISLLETDSLVGDTGENAGLRFLPLGLDGTVGAEPGDGDKAERRQDDQGGA